MIAAGECLHVENGSGVGEKAAQFQMLTCDGGLLGSGAPGTLSGLG